MNPVLNLLLEPLHYEFLTRALAATTIAAAVSGFLSCWLVLIGWSLMGDAVSHAVLPGVVLAYILGLPFAVGALVFGVLAVALIGAVRTGSRVKEDAAIGIVFTTLFAAGLVLISVTPSHMDLQHVVFGNILGVGNTDLIQIGLLAAVASTVLVLKRRDLMLFAFDPVHAQAIGLRPRVLSGILLTLLAFTAVVALQVVGVILVVAMLVIPGATAYLLTDRFERMLLLAPATSVACSMVGIYASFWLDVSSGGIIVVLQGCLFAVVMLLAPRHGVIPRWLARGRAAHAGAEAACTQTASVAVAPSTNGSTPSSTKTFTDPENAAPGT
ncbi:iron chelate uptake ABC transporter family permease subunit [Dermatophilus congolensis]|uniref:iron chelate uptake ABC transporter family permease subunit n=1 Tax=Dermatophilus congolensis TaxID=1863 RepID=UPI001AAECB87|nr:metal ABC transporter permease [Dermatophilus congolensis]MBO3132185.1 metal ABC transporter permease [Dermatophilus congolensis]MBO3133659.1 metal ABC transporter permease [Dermatophilus congolensis]MBO3135892.1 metal ABC transporter permease [Dermatophilus congolensis]MBO3138131.1 metal ABC transporter permease [Dermatophilus congolensis]